MENQEIKTWPLDTAKWREIIEDWIKSGEPQKKYCKRLGLSINTFYYMRNKLRHQSNPTPRFIPLTVKSNEEKVLSSSLIILEDVRGYKLHLPASLSLEQLGKFFKLSGWTDA